MFIFIFILIFVSRNTTCSVEKSASWNCQSLGTVTPKIHDVFGLRFRMFFDQEDDMTSEKDTKTHRLETERRWEDLREWTW